MLFIYVFSYLCINFTYLFVLFLHMCGFSLRD